MKARFSKWILLGVSSGALVVVGATLPQAETTSVAAAPISSVNSTVATTDIIEPASAATLPSNIPAGSPLAQVVRMAQAGVDESVLMSCVSNSTGTFNLDADRIIYLRDVGVPNDLVTAMIQRDQFLQQQMTASAAAQAAQASQIAQTTETTTAETQPVEAAQSVTVNYFYDNLSPYGSWVYVAGYGRCWRPSVAIYNTDWQPYCNGGRWVYTDCGWYWQSDYTWGATFHYGRWFRDARFGWCWWPDTMWAPSWVTWRYSANYCGWAPLPPFATVSAGGFVYRGSSVSVGFSFGLDAGCYTFVATRDFCNPHPYRYRVAAAQSPVIYNETTVINNINVHRDGHRPVVVNTGISPQSLETITHQPIRPVPVNQFTGHRDGRDFPNGNPLALNNGSRNNNGNNSGNNFRPQGGSSGQPDNNRPASQPQNRPGQSTVTVIGGGSPLDRGNRNNSRTSNPYTVYQSPAPAGNSSENSNQHSVTPRQREFEQETPGRGSTPTSVQWPAAAARPQSSQRPTPTVNYRPQPAAPTTQPAQRSLDQPRSDQRGSNPSHAAAPRQDSPQAQSAGAQAARNFLANNGSPNRNSDPDRNPGRLNR